MRLREVTAYSDSSLVTGGYGRLRFELGYGRLRDTQLLEILDSDFSLVTGYSDSSLVSGHSDSRDDRLRF